MIERCTKPTKDGFENYGGRGIRVCERWSSSFSNFIADMGDPPTKAHSIDRINNSGNYEPGNCRWASREDQGRNKRNNKKIEINGVSRCLAEWSEVGKVHEQTIRNRILRGWSWEKAVFTPAMSQFSKHKPFN